MEKNNAKNIFDVLLRVADAIGTVKTAHLYSEDFINIEGKDAEGKTFSITFREEKQDD